MSNRFARFFTLKSKSFNNTSPKNLKLHLSKIMDDVSKAAKGWSNPGVSNIYEKTRPNYNLDSVQFLLEKVGAFRAHPGPEPFTIVELGAGTGKFTRAMLKVLEKREVENFKIISTEPLKEMCEKFKEMVPNVEILQCPASDLNGLPSNCADATLAAQCFHWFGMDKKALNEIHRVLKPKAMFGIIWNLPDRSVSWIKTIEEMLDPKFEDIKIPRPDHEIMFVPLRSHGGFGNEGVDNTSYKYSMELDFEGMIERYRGNSVVAAAPEKEKERLMLAIEHELKSFPSNSVDAVLAAHCFHWFYTDQKAIEEIYRVLKPKGMLGLIWNVPDRSVCWIKEIEEMLDPKFKKIKTPSPYDEVLFTHLHQHGGFGNEGKDVTSYEYSMEMTLLNVIERYKSISVISAAQGIEKEQILQEIEQIMKNKQEVANNEKYIYKFVVKMHWLQKKSRQKKQ